jgi:hypothetical protein
VVFLFKRRCLMPWHREQTFVEFSVPPEYERILLAGLPQHPAPLLDFVALQHLPVEEIHWSGRVPRLPWFHLQGLATLLTAYALLNLVSLISCSQHSWALPLRSFDLAGKYCRVSSTIGPHVVSPSSDTVA